MTRYAGLWVTMLRFRAAAMVWLFMLLGAALHDGLTGPPWRVLLAALALACCYVAATAVNDLADEALDRVNHPSGRGRPLVSGEASRRELRLLAIGAAVAAWACVVPLGAAGFALVCVALAVAHAYSLSPLRLSYRTWTAPLALAVGYVLVPYLLGVVAAGSTPGGRDVVFVSGLCGLFVARIVLKDFRDRQGDLLHGRPTLLLRFGKRATCIVSGAALAAGSIALVAALPVLCPLVLAFSAAIGWILLMLGRAVEPRAEQVAIGIGARMGNGLLTCVLTWLVLASEQAPPGERLALVIAVAALFSASFASLVRRPDAVTIGYKG